MTELKQQLINELDLIPESWSLVPVREKRPYRAGWQTEPTIPRDELRQFLESGDRQWSESKQKHWIAHPEGYGIRTGEWSGGLLAIDVDGPTAEILLQAISLGEIPTTVAWTSGKPGRQQQLYQLSEPLQARLKAVGFTHSALKEAGEFKTEGDEQLDFRYDRCQSVLPPSKHPTTGSYRWINSPEDTEVAAAPHWLEDWLHLRCNHLEQAEQERIRKQAEAESRRTSFRSQFPDSEEINPSTLLNAINPELLDWYEWRNCLLAAQHEGLSESEVRLWSSGSTKHTDRGFNEVWRHIKNSGRAQVTAGTLWYLAESQGWRPPKRKQQRERVRTKTQSKPTQTQAQPETQPEPEKLCGIARDYQALKQILGDRLRLNQLTKDLELDGKPVTLEQLELELALRHNWQSKRLSLVARGLAEEGSYSPVQEYLEKVYSEFKGDTKILEGLALRYFGRSESVYQTFIEKWLVGAVARAYQPGCKLDTALILQGGQGVGKSTFFKVLASDQWFDDSLGNVGDKDERLKLHRAWVVEWSELETVFKRKDVAATKAFLSSSTDQIRPPYGRSVESWQRHSVIVGTTNETEFLGDSTGNRRFWVIPVTQPIDFERLRDERDRIWAAAVALYKAGHAWWLTSEEDKQAAAIAEEYQLRDPWLDTISRYLDGKNLVSTSELLSDCLQIDTARQDRAAQCRVINCLRFLGWTNPTSARVYRGKRQRVWVAPIEPTQPTQHDNSTVSITVLSESLTNQDLQDDRHNRHSTLPKKTSNFAPYPGSPPSSAVEEGEIEKHKSFGDSSCVDCVDAQNTNSARITGSTVPTQPPPQHCVDADSAVSIAELLTTLPSLTSWADFEALNSQYPYEVRQAAWERLPKSEKKRILALKKLSGHSREVAI